MPLAIHWTPDPLDVRIELDDESRSTLLEFLEEQKIEWDNCETMDERLKLYEEALLGRHCGDCIGIGDYCVKCRAEDAFGLDTLEGLSQEEAAAVNTAFRKTESLDGAIDALADWTPDTWNSCHHSEKIMQLWTDCLPRWRAEAAAARTWLIRYRTMHFAKSQDAKGQ